MNAALFSTNAFTAPVALGQNSEGAPAFRFSGAHALAQYAATGCLNATFYADAETQLATVLSLCDGVPTEFAAKTALWARERGFMKDLPAVLVAWLSVTDPVLCDAIFDRVIDDGKMLRNFVQVLRSGQVGRKSLGSMPRRLVRRWFANRTDEQVFRACVGATPSLADVVRMAHPKPETASRAALYAWLIGKSADRGALPAMVRQFEDFRSGASCTVPDVPFQLLTALPLKSADWKRIAEKATFTQVRMNLNTFQRHGVFADTRLAKTLAKRLADKHEIARSKVMPYQLMTTWRATANTVPAVIRDALEEALERSTRNVPALDVKGKVYVCVDVSGSMASPVTGRRKGATTTTRCIDVAALVGASVLRRTPDAEVLPFEHRCVDVKLDADATVQANAAKLAAIGGGGTSCSAPLSALNARGARGGLVLYVSDNESWCDGTTTGHGRGTEMLAEWEVFKRRNPEAKLVCLDVQPNRTTQARERADILNIGGFSDAVFDVIGAFVRATDGARTWVQAIDALAL